METENNQKSGIDAQTIKFSVENSEPFLKVMKKMDLKGLNDLNEILLLINGYINENMSGKVPILYPHSHLEGEQDIGKVKAFSEVIHLIYQISDMNYKVFMKLIDETAKTRTNWKEAI